MCSPDEHAKRNDISRGLNGGMVEGKLERELFKHSETEELHDLA